MGSILTIQQVKEIPKTLTHSALRVSPSRVLDDDS